MLTSSAANITPFTRHRNPLHLYLITIHCLKVYELILCSENNDNGNCMDMGQVRSTTDATWQGQNERTNFTTAGREKKIQDQNHASKAHGIMQAVDKDETA